MEVRCAGIKLWVARHPYLKSSVLMLRKAYSFKEVSERPDESLFLEACAQGRRDARSHTRERFARNGRKMGVPEFSTNLSSLRRSWIAVAREV